MSKFIAGLWLGVSICILCSLFSKDEEKLFNSLVDISNGILKDVSELSILVDSKIVDINQSYEEDFIEIKYENNNVFYMEYSLEDNNSISYSKLMFTNDDFNIKEYLMIISDEYLADNIIEELKTDGLYEYVNNEGIKIVYNFTDSDINILEAKFSCKIK